MVIANKKVEVFVCKICNKKLTEKQLKRKNKFCSRTCQNEGWKTYPGVEITKEYIKVRRREYHLTSKFGITDKDYKIMFQNQKGKCAICKNTCSVIDHCHNTGKIRGLLCQRCNMGLGYFQDDKELLLKANKYIKNHESK